MIIPPRRTVSTTLLPPLFIADHLALDFINSEFGVPPDRIECLNSDAQVFEWLQRAGASFEVAELPRAGQNGELLRLALALRATSRELLLSRKAGRVGNPAALNLVLARGGTYQEVIWGKAQPPKRLQHRRVATPADLLVPVAEAMAELLAEGDFTLVRKCESPDCTLWFYDRTKSHHRRWCSMAVCGNRMKVAAFRARHRAQ
ncbi:MAG: CGNR zinc finger domain-containing protein [Betaproteobacteria bacterium]